MNTIRSVFLLGLAAGVLAHAERLPCDFAKARPERKHALEVNLHRNPFQAGVEAERPLPVLRDRDDPALRLPAVLGGHIRSVLRHPHALLLIDTRVCQPGDEVMLGGRPVLEKYRVTLKSVEADRAVFLLTSLDAQHPGQLDSAVLLPAALSHG